MKELVMTIGLPYSGKSTVAKDYVKKGYFLIERDILVNEILKSVKFAERVKIAVTPEIENDKKRVFDIKNEIATEMLNAKIADIVEKEKPEKIIYDGTNLQRGTRKGLLDLKRFGYRVKAIVLPIDEKTFVERHVKTLMGNEREGKFNERAHLLMGKFISMLEDPTEDEGFDEVEVWTPSELSVETVKMK